MKKHTALLKDLTLELAASRGASQSSPWALTLLHSPVLPPLPPNDYSLGHHVYEIEWNSELVAADPDTWNSWTGRRYLDGVEFHGPVTTFGTSSLYTGKRSCGCSACATATLPIHKPN